MNKRGEAYKKESKFVSVVVYLHNDSENIAYFFDGVLGVLQKNFERYEVICVNDASTDHTIDVLKEYFGKEGEQSGIWDGSMVSIVHMSYFQGLEPSMNAGRDMAIGDFVYEFDDIDLDYSTGLIREVYDRMLSGYDVVAAGCKSRTRLTSGLFYYIFNKTSYSGNRIGQETFRILSRRAVNRIMSIGRYIPYRKAVYMNCGLKADTVYYESLHGKGRRKSRAGRTERTSLALDSFIYFTDVMERISLCLSGAFLFFTLGVIFYIVASIFSSYKPVEGWLSTMGVLSLGFFGVFVLLTIMLKYLSVLLNLIFKHQRYLIEGIEKISKD